MKKIILLLAGICWLGFCEPVHAAESSTAPVPRDPKWVTRHEKFVAEAKAKGPSTQVLFLGDSITDFWRDPKRGLPVWEKNYAGLPALNLGISGDRTEHVLWRIDNGELAGWQPKVVVLMIGTNNTGMERDEVTPRNTPPETVAGVTAVIRDVRKRAPEAKILFLAIFPRGKPDSLERKQIAEINPQLQKLDDGNHVFFLDIGSKFLQPDGTISKEIMPDSLHPSQRGYEIWAEAMRAPLANLLK